jgi:transcriptional regulator with XRE-family HTH domain
MPYPPPRRLWVQLISRVTLRALCEHQDLTVRELADKSRVNKSTIGHLLSGQRDTCLSRNAKAIAKALGVPTEALFHAQVSTVAPVARQSRKKVAA